MTTNKDVVWQLTKLLIDIQIQTAIARKRLDNGRDIGFDNLISTLSGYASLTYDYRDEYIELTKTGDVK